MIEINHSLLTAEALDNLLLDIITRQATDYGALEVDFVSKKNQLIRKLETGEILILYCSKEGVCDLIKAEDMKALQYEATVPRTTKESP